MAIDLAPLIAPASTAFVVFECQEALLGRNSILPGLAAAAESGEIIPHIAELLASARAANVRVFYVMMERRPDGIGNPFNLPLEIRLQERGGGGAVSLGEIVSPIAPADGEVVIHREHGLTGFYESGLDSYLRNTGIRSIVLTGVSVNLGILGTAIEAANRGYKVIVPTDAVAGDPPEYAEQALRYAVGKVAFLTRCDEVMSIWRN